MHCLKCIVATCFAALQAFKSPMQRGSNRPSDVSKRVTVWECAALESPGEAPGCPTPETALHHSHLRHALGLGRCDRVYSDNLSAECSAHYRDYHPAQLPVAFSL